MPLKESIDEYFKREVLPHVPDAWIDESKTKVGYEIPLNRHFYRYEPPRPLEVIEADIKTLEERDPGAAQRGDGVRSPGLSDIQAERRRMARRCAGALGSQATQMVLWNVSERTDIGPLGGLICSRRSSDEGYHSCLRTSSPKYEIRRRL